MADENNFQNRTNNSSEREAANSGQGTDPLAELARLIGQNDPFSEFGRDARAAVPAPTPPRPMPSEQPLVAPPYSETRDQSGGAAPYQFQQNPPAFIQAAPESGAYRDAVYRDSGQMPPGNDFYDETEPRGRGRGFITAAAVIALAVLGTAGAFGYRFIFSSSGSSGPPPVIRANPEPTKVPPPVANAESSQSKSTYDRVGDRGQGERVVVREEPPVDVKDLTRPGVGRSPPPPNSANQWAQAVPPNLPPTGSAAATGAPSSTMMGEPKKVRTVTIRPDSPDANMAPPSLGPPNSSASPPAPSARSVPTTPQAPVQQRQVVVSQPAPPPANAPLALNDDMSLSLPRALNAPPAAPPRQAPVQKPAPAPRAAPASRPGPQVLAQVAAPKAGGYLVQVSSQRSEGEAQAALRGLQAKFPNVLGGQPATVRRAELGERGVFFRAMLGPFANRDQATQLCGNLKAAGGDCIVQGN